MSYILALKPAIGLYGQHDSSAAFFEDGELARALLRGLGPRLPEKVRA
jgi:carbamoyltransferase